MRKGAVHLNEPRDMALSVGEAGKVVGEEKTGQGVGKLLAVGCKR